MTSAAGGFAAALYENLPFPVLVLDAQVGLVSFNEAAARAFGWNRETMPPERAQVLEGEAPVETLARHAAEGRENAHALCFRHGDGSTFEATAHVIALADDATGARYALLLRSLLSGGSHGEQILLGQRVSAALDTMAEGFAIFDRSERLVMFNRVFKERCGPAREAVRVGATLESIVRASVRAGIYAGMEEGTPEAEAFVEARLLDHRNTDSGGTVFVYGDGRWLRSESHVTERGDIVALRIDVTDLKNAEAALEAKRREYLSLLQILPDMIVRFDRSLVVRFANDKYARRFGLSADDLIGTSLLSLPGSPVQRRMLEDLDSFTPEAPIRSREVRYETPGGGEGWVLWTAVATFDGDRPVEFVGVGRDITEAKRQQQRVEAQAAELKSKNEALDQFTATVSHDLKAPLRHLSMFAEMISEDLHRGNLDELQHYADHVRKSAARMRRIIDSLLEFSQIAYQIVTPKPVSLDDVVRDALLLLEGHVREADARIEVGPLPAVLGDPELLKRLAQNLIGNAIKYRKPDEPPRVRIYGRMHANGVDFVVEDEGIGIAPQYAAKIFEVFQRLHRDETIYQGTGVGLALARRIVESHKGAITLDTSYGPGARFVVTFPRSPE